MSNSVIEEMFFSPNTEKEIPDAQVERFEPIERVHNTSNNDEYDMKAVEQIEDRFFQSNSQVRSQKITSEFNYQTQRLSAEKHDNMTPNLKTSYTRYHPQPQYPRLNPLAEFNLFNLQEVIVLLQQSEIQNQDLDNRLTELLQFNEAALMQQDNYFEDDQASPLMERNSIQSQQIKELFEFNQQITQQNTGLKVQIIELEQQLDQISQKCQFFEDTLQQVDQEKTQLNEDFECLYQFLQDQTPSQNMIASRSSTNDIVIAKIQLLVDERNNLQEEVQTLYKNIESQQGHYNQLLQDNQQLLDTNLVIKEENDEIQDQFKSLQIQYDEFKLHLKQFQQQNETLEQQNEQLQGVYNINQEEFLKSSHQNEQQIRERDMEIYKLNMENENFQRLMSQKDQIIQNIQEEFQQLLDQAEQSFTSEKHLLRENLTELQSLQRTTQIDLDETSNGKARLEDENHELRDRIRQLENQQQLEISRIESNHEQYISQIQKDRDVAYQKQKQKKQGLEQETFKLNKLNVELQIRLNQSDHERKLLKDQGKELIFELESVRSIMLPQIESLKKQLLASDQQLSKVKVHENVELEHLIIFMEGEKSDLELLCRRQKKVLNQI